jgi:hypothetical protein
LAVTSGRIRHEAIEPPDPPDANMRRRLVAAFSRLPRVAEAWLEGARLTPDDGSPPWETTHVILVLDPPLPEDPTALREEMAAMARDLASIGWATPGERERGWGYAPYDNRFTGMGVRIYRRGAEH